MAEQQIRYLKIRKKDANGKLINLDPFQAVGEILTIDQKPGGYNAGWGDYKSQFKIITVQETQTSFILEVEEVNTQLAGGLSQVFNSLTSSYWIGPTDIEGDAIAFIGLRTDTTGQGKNAFILVERRDPDPVTGTTGSMNYFRVISRGNNYATGDLVGISTADSGLSSIIIFSLDYGGVSSTFGTEGWIANSSKELITQANIPYYASFSMENTNGTTLTDIKAYSGSGTQYSYMFKILPFIPQTDPGFERPPFSRDSIRDLTNKSAYEFGMQPPFPIEWTLEFKGIKSDSSGHFFFNMFQYQDKFGDGMNRFCGKRFAVDKVVDNFRGFSLSSSIDRRQGSSNLAGSPNALTGPVKLFSGTTQNITISGSIRADFIVSGSSWYPGVSRSPIDFDQNSLNPTIEWTEATWSMKYPDTASAYMMNWNDNLPPYTSSLNASVFSVKGQDTSQLIGIDEFIDPLNGLWATWDNSDYNPILGNVNQQRRNSRIMVMEYNHQTGSTTPSNRLQIISRSAELAEVPDSNYTMRSITYPRYIGSRLYSADYNFYTKRGRIGVDPNFSFGFPGFQPKMTQSLLEELANPVIDQFLNGDTCSIAPQYQYPTNSNATASKQWFGDISYGKEAAINRNPIYIAHFQKSIDDYLYWGSRKFDLDALIEIPLEDITGEQGFQAIPIPLEGEGERQFDVAMTFEAGRDAAAIFNQIRTGGIDFSTIPRRKRKKTRRRRVKSQAGEILDGGMKYTLLYTNESAETGSYQFTSAPFYAYRKNRRKIRAKQSDVLPNMAQDNVGDGAFSESIQMVTGSTEYGVDENFFILSGSVFPASGSAGAMANTPEPIPFARTSKRPPYLSTFFAKLFFNNAFSNFYALGGPQLATIHTHNYYLYNNIKAGIFDQYATARNLAFMPNVSSKRLRYYWKFLPNSSGAPRYENDREPFLILPGDEIRVEAEISTAAFEGHTGSLKSGINQGTNNTTYVDGQIYNNPAGYAWNSYFRSINSGYTNNSLGFSGESYNLSTTTNGQGVGAELYVQTRDEGLLGGEWVVNQTTNVRGWLGMIVDGYFCSNANYRGDTNGLPPTNAAAAGNTYYGIQPNLTDPSGNPYTNYITGELVVGEDAKFDITYTAGGNLSTITVTAPGKNYKYGDRFRFVGTSLGGSSTTDDINMLIGLRVGVGKAPTSKMAFDAIAMHPDAGVDAAGVAWSEAPTFSTLNFDVTFTGETGFEDAKATKIKLNRVGISYGDGGYLVFTSTRLRDYGAGTGKCIQEMYGTGVGITGYSYEDVQPSGSQKAFEDLVIEIQPGSSKCGPVNMEYTKPGKGYKAGDFLYVSKNDSNWVGPGPDGDLVVQIGPDDVQYQDTSKTTQNITFQVLAVSQSTYWSASAVPDGTGPGEFSAAVPFPRLNNAFSWMGLATGSGIFNGDQDSYRFVNLVSYIDGAVGGDSGVPGDNGQANGADGATNCSTTLQDSPNSGGGSGLKVDITTMDQIITSVVPNTSNLGSGYCVGDVIKVDVSTGTGWVGSAGTDFTFTVPAQAIEETEGFEAGAVTLQGQYGGVADKIFVHPNPKEALYGIDNGEIKNVTFRRRTPSDQSALLMLDAPSGSRGRLTPSGDGYLIPSDLTPTQKKNALSIINKLNAQNAFRKNN